MTEWRFRWTGRRCHWTLAARDVTARGKLKANAKGVVRAVVSFAGTGQLELQICRRVTK